MSKRDFTSLKLRIPKGWTELDDKEIEIVFKLLVREDVTIGEVPAMALMKLSRIRVLARNGHGHFALADPFGGIVTTTPEVLASIAKQLQWIINPPETPWRPQKLAGGWCVDADFGTLTFADWIAIDGAYQGVVYTQNLSLLERCRAQLVKGSNRSFELWECMAVLHWIMSAKRYLEAEYPDFFSPAPAGTQSDDLRRQLREGLDAQIRALTKGDVTKEDDVLQRPLYRVLAELNAQAREYEEMKRIYKK